MVILHQLSQLFRPAEHSYGIACMQRACAFWVHLGMIVLSQKDHGELVIILNIPDGFVH